MYVINTNKILQIVKVMPEGDVTIEVDERNRVRVTGGQSSFEITAQNGEDFPTMPMFKGDNIFTLPQHSLRDLLDATVFAVAQNDQRPAFNGALVRIRDGVITLVGSDGNRLAIAAALHEHLAVGALEDIVVLKLEARDAVAVRVDEAKHLTANGTVRIDALHVRESVDAGDAILRERGEEILGHIGVDLALHIGEGGVLGERRQVIIRRAAKGVRKLLGTRGLVRDLFGIAVDGTALDARGEDVAIAS